jgi:hypothetical protein
MQMENNYDETMNRTKALENWTDIYLPKQGKHILGIADGLICEKLREKIFVDVGRPDLKERCLELIERLKIDANILTSEDFKDIKDAKRAYE